jgi:hypothetical protein
VAFEGSHRLPNTLELERPQLPTNKLRGDDLEVARHHPSGARNALHLILRPVSEVMIDLAKEHLTIHGCTRFASDADRLGDKTALVDEDGPREICEEDLRPTPLH